MDMFKMVLDYLKENGGDAQLFWDQVMQNGIPIGRAFWLAMSEKDTVDLPMTILSRLHQGYNSPVEEALEFLLYKKRGNG